MTNNPLGKASFNAILPYPTLAFSDDKGTGYLNFIRVVKNQDVIHLATIIPTVENNND